MENGIPFTSKSGGYSLYSTIDDSGVIIDLSEFAGVEHDRVNKTAVLKGGVSSKTVAVDLAKDGCCTSKKCPHLGSQNMLLTLW